MADAGYCEEPTEHGRRKDCCYLSFFRQRSLQPIRKHDREMSCSGHINPESTRAIELVVASQPLIVPTAVARSSSAGCSPVSLVIGRVQPGLARHRQGAARSRSSSAGCNPVSLVIGRVHPGLARHRQGAARSRSSLVGCSPVSCRKSRARVQFKFLYLEFPVADFVSGIDLSRSRCSECSRRCRCGRKYGSLFPCCRN